MLLISVVIFNTVKRPYNEGQRDRQNMFALTRFFYWDEEYTEGFFI